jgi:hypothetical protein
MHPNMCNPPDAPWTQRSIDIIRCWRDVLGLTVVLGNLYFGGMPRYERQEKRPRDYSLAG